MLVKISTIEKIRSFYRLLPLLLLCLAFNSCKKSPPTKFISGSVQKGPFLNGSSVTLFELNDSYTQTGQSFSTQITNNLGSFILDNVVLASDYVSLRADGYYFNEVCGENSVAPITLSCIADIQNVPSMHINLLTHLEKPRVEYLLANGSNFIAAKKQAQIEVLSIFNLSSSMIDNSENLDISASGEGNAILLAVTSILQGFRTESELSNILSDISSDIRTDGILNDTIIQSALIAHALILDTVSVRNNITDYYAKRNVQASIGNFEQYITQFIHNSTYSRYGSVIDYDENGGFGANILNKTQLNYTGICSFAAGLKKCTPLTVKLTVLSGPVYFYSSNINWKVTVFNWTSKSQTFTTLNSYDDCDIRIEPGGANSSIIRVDYFEQNLMTPSYTKIITFSE